MLGSREDAEDVLQEVFAAAFNAILGDDRPINVRPWLYRIARNRSLNHLRRQQAIGVDSMDIHLSEGGQTTADKVHKREEFRALLGDVRQLPETQRTALLLREIDALSYEQIAEAMETTVPAVKSLLVRARVALAEMAEARHLTCEEVREELGEVAEGLKRLSPPVRRHLKACDRCANFRRQLKQTNKALASIMPVGPLLVLKKLLLAHLGTTASASGAATAGAATAGVAGGAATGGAVSAGLSAVASKAAAGLAAAAIVSVGAVEVKRARVPQEHPPAQAAIVVERPASVARADHGAGAPPAHDGRSGPPAQHAAVPAAPAGEADDRPAADDERTAPTARTRKPAKDAAAGPDAPAAEDAATEPAKPAAPVAPPAPAPAPPSSGPAPAPAPQLPTGGTEQGVDTVVLPPQQPAQPGTGGTAAPPEPPPAPAVPPAEPAPVAPEQPAPPPSAASE
jgi:RNA polymerase sigma factor (sigma-70 family)